MSVRRIAFALALCGAVAACGAAPVEPAPPPSAPPGSTPVLGLWRECQSKPTKDERATCLAEHFPTNLESVAAWTAQTSVDEMSDERECMVRVVTPEAGAMFIGWNDGHVVVGVAGEIHPQFDVAIRIDALPAHASETQGFEGKEAEAVIAEALAGKTVKTRHYPWPTGGERIWTQELDKSFRDSIERCRAYVSK